MDEHFFGAGENGEFEALEHPKLLELAVAAVANPELVAQTRRSYLLPAARWRRA
jgi:hypothetical protein